MVRAPAAAQQPRPPLRNMRVPAAGARPRRRPADAAAIRSINAASFVIVVHIGIEIALLLHDDFPCGWRDRRMRSKSETGDRADRSRHRAARRNRPVDHLFPLVTGLSGVDQRSPRHRAIGAEEAGFPSRRAPLALLVHRHDKHPRPSRDKVADITPSVAIGSGNRFLHDVIRQRLAGTDRRIALPQPRVPARVVKSAPNLAAISLARRGQGGHRRWFSIRRGRQATGGWASSAPSADTGSGLDRLGFPRRHGRCGPMDMTRSSSRAHTPRWPGDGRPLTAKPCAVNTSHVSRISAVSPAEQMGAAGDVEKTGPCGESSATSGREAVAPVGDVYSAFSRVRNFVRQSNTFNWRTDGRRALASGRPISSPRRARRHHPARKSAAHCFCLATTMPGNRRWKSLSPARRCCARG